MWPLRFFTVSFTVCSWADNKIRKNNGYFFRVYDVMGHMSHIRQNYTRRSQTKRRRINFNFNIGGFVLLKAMMQNITSCLS
jgi:hypothetical protein